MTEEIQKELLFKIEVKYLLGVCKNIKELITEARFNLNKNGLRITEIDPSNVCMIDVVLNSGLFQELTTDTEIKTYGLSVDSLDDILKEQKKQDVKVFEEKGVLTNKLIFMFDNGFKSELSLIDIETEKKELPILEHKTTIELSSSRFKEIIKNCFNIAESLSIENKDNSIYFTAESGIKKTEINLNTDEVRITGENSKSKYSLEYLNKFIKELMTDKVILKFSSDYPLIVDYLTEGLNISYVLAPRVGED